MLLQSHGRFAAVAEFDPDTRALEERLWPAGQGVADTDGWYSVLDERLVVFYWDFAGVYLRVSNQVWPVDDGLQVSWSRDRDRDLACFTIYDGSATIQLVYSGQEDQYRLLEHDLTMGVEPEHWDFGLFITNLVYDKERLERIRCRGK